MSAAVPLAAIEQARERIAGSVLRTPLVPFEAPGGDIHLKLECLQPIGSFKLRGALNAIRAAGAKAARQGVLTVSAGNMGQGVAWAARELGVPATVVAPDHAPQTKREAMERLGAEVLLVSVDRWFDVLRERRLEGRAGLFVHPVDDEHVMAGNGTIGLELAEDLPDVDTVYVPVGGGGLATGIACALAALRPSARVIGVVPDTAPALAAAFDAGRPVDCAFTPSWVDGAGAKLVLDAMWPRLRAHLAGAVTVSLDEAAEAVRRLAGRTRVVAEGAGALALAAALGDEGRGRAVAVVSGGNIDVSVLARILSGRTP